ncbi:MAG: hypothetical protein ACQEXJ_22075 [Myxococcota bacterium]
MDMNTHRNRMAPRTILTSAVAALALLLVAPSTSAEPAKDGAPKLEVGTYEPQVVFESYPGKKKAMEDMAKVQADMQKAQQQGDQQQMMQLQQKAQAQQKKVLDDFEKAVRETVPDVAKAEGIDLVAVEVSYASDEVETVDLTQKIIGALKKGGDKGSKR